MAVPVCIDNFNQGVLSFMSKLEDYSKEIEFEGVNFNYYSSLMRMGIYWDKEKILHTFNGLLKGYYQDIEDHNAHKLFETMDFESLGSSLEAMLIVPLWKDLQTMWPHLDKEHKDVIWEDLKSISHISRELTSVFSI